MNHFSSTIRSFQPARIEFEEETGRHDHVPDYFEAASLKVDMRLLSLVGCHLFRELRVKVHTVSRMCTGTMTTPAKGSLSLAFQHPAFSGKVSLKIRIHSSELAPPVSGKGKVEAITITQIPDLVCSLSLAIQGT
jgi:hypothetical protein